MVGVTGGRVKRGDKLLQKEGREEDREEAVGS